MQLRPKERPWNWTNIAFLAVVHLVGIGGTVAYLLLHGPSLAAVVAAVIWAGATIFSISAGYHRLFSHRAYEAHPLLRLFLLLFGAASFQNSALEWALDHRVHHARVDTDEDPYSIRQGFWYAHVGWVLRKSDPSVARPAATDLMADRLVRWQARHFVPLATFMGFLLPLGLGFLFGDPWGLLLLAGFLRLVLVLHATFSINSLTHTVGAQPYSRGNSARDSLIAALVTMGEGYHNYHHTFPADYRNGVGRFQFDPTKWILRALASLRITRNLRRTALPKIYRARMQVDAERLGAERLDAARPQAETSPAAAAIAARRRFDEWAACWNTLRADIAHWTAQVDVSAGKHLRLLRSQLRQVGRQMRTTYATWRMLVAASALRPQAA
jgi:stearoyl-CoA desaturase (delta-9 desaturase)